MKMRETSGGVCKAFLMFLCLLVLCCSGQAKAMGVAYPPDGVYSLQPKCAPGAELATERQSKEKGTNVVISPFSSNNIKWRITRIGNGQWYKIMVEGANTGLNVHNGIRENCTNISLWEYAGIWQQFRFLDAGNGYYAIEGNIGGNPKQPQFPFVLDVANGTNNTSANVWNFNYNGSDAQKWKLVKATTPIVTKGDVNGDGEIDISDCVMLLNYIHGMSTSLPNKTRADMNNDGKLDINDVVAIKHKITDGPTDHNPQGKVESVDSPGDYQLHVKGYAYDEDNMNGSLAVHVYVGGTPGSQVPQWAISANKTHRVMGNHGFEDVHSNIDSKYVGRQLVHVYALNLDGTPGNFKEIWNGYVDIKGTAQPSPAPVQQERTGWVNTKNQNLNMRATPGGQVIGKLAKGTQVTVLETGSNGWTKVRTASGQIGYVSSQYISFDSTPTPQTNDDVTLRLEQLANSASGYKMGTKYTGDGQCRGFANKVYLTTFKGVQYISGYANKNYSASNYSGSYVAGELFDFASNDTASVKRLFGQAKIGAFIQMGRRHSLNSTKTAPSPHSAILYSINENGVQFFEANTDGKNTIRVNTYTWAQLADKNKGFTIYLPNNYSVK